MTAGLKSLPQNSVNQRPTMALLLSVDMSHFLPRAVALPAGCAQLEDAGRRADVSLPGGAR